MKYLFFLITFLVAGTANAQEKQFILERSGAAEILARLEEATVKPSHDLCSRLLTLELYTQGSESRYTNALIASIESGLYEKLGRRPLKGKTPNTTVCIAMKKTTRYDLCGVFRNALGAESSVPCLGPGYSLGP